MPLRWQAFVRGYSIDYLSPQLYTVGNEAQNDFSTTNNVGWNTYAGTPARLVPSLVKASYYQNAQQFFGNMGIATAGFVQWNNE